MITVAAAEAVSRPSAVYQVPLPTETGFASASGIIADEFLSGPINTPCCEKQQKHWRRQPVYTILMFVTCTAAACIQFS